MTTPWEPIQRAAQGTALTANQLVMELAIETLDPRDWPKTEAEIRVARASLFAAQAIARDMIAAGRENEVQEIREFISTIVPDADTRLPAQLTTATDLTTPNTPIPSLRVQHPRPASLLPMPGNP